MNKSKLILPVILTIFLIAAAVILLISKPTESENSGATEIQKTNRESAAPVTSDLSEYNFVKTEPVQQSQLAIINDPYDPEQVTEDVEFLRDMTQPESKAIEHLHIVLNQIRAVYGGEYPTTDGNIEMANALLGKNKRALAFFPQAHPRLNSDGELIDKYGSAYYFHFHSAKNLYIRSYGPDKEPYTEDDIVQNLSGDTDDTYRSDIDPKYSWEKE